MSRYNHFGVNKYPTILFDEVKVGDKFRLDRHVKGRRVKDIVMIKTGALSYQEEKTKKEYNLFHSNNFEVGAYELKIKQ